MIHPVSLAAAAAAAAVVALSAAPARACPSDLGRPVAIDWTDGTTSTFADVGNATVTETMVETDGAVSVYESYKGLIETAYRYSDGAAAEPELTRYSYDFDLASAFPLRRGGIVGGTQTARHADGSTETAIVSFQPQAAIDIQIGDCKYVGRRVFMSFFGEYGLSLVEFLYLESLGFGTVVSYTGDGARDVYTPVAIGVAE